MQRRVNCFCLSGSYADATDWRLPVSVRCGERDGWAGGGKPASLSGIQDPSYLAVSQDGKFVYSVSETTGSLSSQRMADRRISIDRCFIHFYGRNGTGKVSFFWTP